MTTDPDGADEALEGQLGTVTDDEWRTAHEALIASGDLPADELTYTWNPELDPATLIGDDEVNHARLETDSEVDDA
jgi:hypothetical protein